ncbi:hypothetical protein BH11PSE8_BH11PSE8_30100 [soil metagenome]
MISKPFAAVALVIAMGNAFAADVGGTTTAAFIDPAPATATTTGVGTDVFTWGIGSGTPASSLSFVGGAFASGFETPFKVGSLTYFNGAIEPNTGAESVTLSLNLDFTQPALGMISSSYKLDLINTPNVDDPDAAADYVYLPSSFSTTSFTIDGTEYRVKLTGFQNVTGDGFLDSNSQQFHVREAGTASADLFAVVTSQALPPVPEPSTYALMLGGLAAIGAVARRRKSQG